MKPRYKIVQTPRVERNFRRLNSESQRTVAEKVLLLETDPAAGKPFHGELKGLSSLRVGRYWGVYEIQDGKSYCTWWHTGEQHTVAEV